MANRMLSAVIAAFIAVLSVGSVDAWARAGGAGRAGAPGFSRFGMPPFVHRATVPHFGAYRAGRFRAGHPVTWRYRRPYRFPYPVVWPYYGPWSGGYFDWPGTAEFFDPYGGVAMSAPGFPAASAVSLALEGPSCRLESDTRTVPSDDGSERKITITRCVAPRGFPAADSEADRNSAGRDPADDRASDAIVAGVPNESGEDGRNRRVCRMETRTVPSEAGGDRTITIRRC